jgi:hypothetical protein
LPSTRAWPRSVVVFAVVGWHSKALIALKAYPLFDPLRGDPWFQDLLCRLGQAE